MIYLLDTHVLLWWLSDNPRLSLKARQIIANPKQTVVVSSVSAWEISIKKTLGKLEAPDNLIEELEKNRFLSLPITISHALTAGNLPLHHHDPFDRMLIAQAKLEKMTIVTHEKFFQKYKIKLVLV